MSKGRYLAAQLLALIEDDVWLSNAQFANRAAQRLAEAAKERLVYPVEANEVFLRLTASEAVSLRAEGFDFYDWANNEVRLVVSWDQPQTEIDTLATALRAL